MDIYDKIEQLMSERKISAYRLAKEIGVSTALMTQWKQRKHSPSREKLEAIASYFGVSVDYLLGRAETPEIKNSPPETDGEYGQIVASGGHGVIVLKRASDAPKEGVVRVSLTYSSGVTESHDVDEEATHAILSLIRLVEIK